MSKQSGGRFSSRWLGPALLVANLVACSAPEVPETSAGRADGLALPDAAREFIEVEAAGTQVGAPGSVLPGRVAFRPQAVAAVDTPVEARIVSVAVRPGQVVKTGDALVTLQSADAAAARATLAQASALAAAAEDLLRRQHEMLDKGVGLEVERFAAETAAREARAELARARQAVALIGTGSGDRFVLRAPVSGTVLAVRANVGTVASASDEALVDIGDPGRLWVVADIPESEAAGIVSGLAATIHVPGADATFPAHVDGVGQMLDAELRRLPVYLTLQGDAHELVPGMLAEVRIERAGGQALSLSVAAVLIKDGSQRIVYVQRGDGKYEARPVRTSMSRGGRVTILEGLQPGEQVVVRGALLLDAEAEQLL